MTSGTLTMFDSAYNDEFPAGGDAYAAYVDGGIGNQPNYAYIVSAFPKAQHLSIALFASDDADALDVEPGAASPSDIPGWFARQVARGVHRPVIYASVSAMDKQIVPIVQVLPGARGAVRLWTAHYESNLGPHLCGPTTCGELIVDADATQWTSNAMGRVLDESLLRGDFFSVPDGWTFGSVRGLDTEAIGPHSVRLSWSSPDGFLGVPPSPEPGVDHYQVTIRYQDKDLPDYPVGVSKDANPQSEQFNGLRPGTPYEALVRAADRNGKHASPWAKVTFTTPAE